MIKFTIPGEPTPKGRPRLAFKGGRGHAYTPAKTRAYEQMVGLYARSAMKGAKPFKDRGHIRLLFVMKRPLKGKTDSIYHTGRPDLDNLVKAVTDAMNGIVYEDDGQIYRIDAQKIYGNEPRVEVEIL